MNNINSRRHFAADKVLFSSTNLCEQVFEHANDVILAVDDQFQIILFNKAAETKFGCTRQAAVGKSLFQFFEAAHNHQFMEQARQVMQGQVQSQSLRMHQNERCFEWKLLPLTDSYHRCSGVLCIINDHTAHVENEYKIEELHRRLHEKQFLLKNRSKMAETIIDASSDLIMVLDRHLRFCAVNKAFQQYCGRQHDALLGKTIFDCFPQVRDAEILLKIKAAFDGMPSSIKRLPFTLKTGYCNVQIRPLTYDKFVYGVLIIAHDITELDTASRELQAANEQLQKQHAEIVEKTSLVKGLFNTTKSIIALYDRDLNFIDVNNSYLQYLNLKKEEVVGKNLLDIYPEISSHEIFGRIQKALQGEAQLFYQYKYLKKPGYGALSIIPLANSNGEITKIVIIGQQEGLPA